jgi:hypothetical protein
MNIEQLKSALAKAKANSLLVDGNEPTTSEELNLINQLIRKINEAEQIIHNIELCDLKIAEAESSQNSADVIQAKKHKAAYEAVLAEEKDKNDDLSTDIDKLLEGLEVESKKHLEIESLEEKIKELEAKIGSNVLVEVPQQTIEELSKQEDLSKLNKPFSVFVSEFKKTAKTLLVVEEKIAQKNIEKEDIIAKRKALGEKEGNESIGEGFRSQQTISDDASRDESQKLGEKALTQKALMIAKQIKILDAQKNVLEEQKTEQNKQFNEAKASIEEQNAEILELQKMKKELAALKENRTKVSEGSTKDKIANPNDVRINQEKAARLLQNNFRARDAKNFVNLVRDVKSGKTISEARTHAEEIRNEAKNNKTEIPFG